MQRIQQLIVFLLCSFSMHAMELTSCNSFSGLDILTKDFLNEVICSRLDRQDRNALRRTSQKYLKSIFSQDDLNKHYMDAYNKKDQRQMAYWKSLGGCFDYQEFADAIKNKKYYLTRCLIRQWGDGIWQMFYVSNLKVAAETKTVSEMVLVVKYLLYATEPDNIDFQNSYKFTKSLVEKYPEVKEILDLCDTYAIDQQVLRENQRMIAQACSGLSIASCYGPTTGYYYPNQS